MTDLRTAAQQALEALEWHYRQGHSNTLGGFRLKIDEKALRELRAALAQQAEPLNLRDPAVQKRLATQWGYVPAAQAEPVQEPVAWNWMLDGLPYGRACYGDPPDADLAERAATAGRTVRLLYTAPPQRKQAESVQMHPSQFAELIKGKETMIGVPVYWSEWPNKERT